MKDQLVPMFNGIKTGMKVRVYHLELPRDITGEDFTLMNLYEREKFLCTGIDYHTSYCELSFVSVNKNSRLSDGHILGIRESFNAHICFKKDIKDRWSKSCVR